MKPLGSLFACFSHQHRRRSACFAIQASKVEPKAPKIEPKSIFKKLDQTCDMSEVPCHAYFEGVVSTMFCRISPRAQKLRHAFRRVNYDVKRMSHLFVKELIASCKGLQNLTFCFIKSIKMRSKTCRKRCKQNNNSIFVFSKENLSQQSLPEASWRLLVAS